MKDTGKQKEKRGICGLCSAGCWIAATYDEKGRIVKVRPDEGSPMGIICKIGEHTPDILYSKERLLHPLKRKGQKGNYDFEKISWDEAYGFIVDKLQAIKKDYGPEAAAIYTGVGSFEQSICDMYQPKGVAVSSANSVLFPYGSPNTMGVGALCYVSYGMIAPHVTMGRMFINMFSDIENSELIVIWGTNPATDLPAIDIRRVLAARQKNAEVVVIDPRKTMTVKLTGAEWLPLRPGTDGALALGLCNVLIREELYDTGFVQNWTSGFDAFSRYVQHYRPEVVEHITGIPAEKVVNLSRRIAKAKGVSQLMYTGLEYANSGVQNIRATLVLWALAGQLDVPGGLCFSMKENHFPINKDRNITNPDRGTRLGRDKFPVYIKYRDEAHAIALPESVLKGNPYRVRSLIILGSSIITSWPNPETWKKTLKELDFLVCINRQLTADAAYADIVLPATTYYENLSYMTYGSMFKIRERMIPPVGEARSDVLILAELAKRLGYGHLYPQSEEEMIEDVLKGSGFTLDDVRKAGGTVSIETRMMVYKKWQKGLLREDKKPGFDTPTGKFEIASTILEEYGYDPLPKYTEPKEGPLSQPGLLKKYPLVFNSGARVRTGFHTQHHHIEKLGKDRPEPAVTINTQDAEERGIRMGETVLIKTKRGAVKMRAYVTDDIVKGAIDANHAGGGPLGAEAWQDANINALTDLDNYDPISGFPVYKSLLCDVVRLDNQQDAVIVDSGELKEDELQIKKEEETPFQTVYIDNNATTPLAPEVRDTMVAMLTCYGNPSSIHHVGVSAGKAIDEGRRQVADLFTCTAKRIVFTGSGSEANNLAIKGIAFNLYPEKNHIITTKVEHPSVLNACHWLEKRGFTVSFVDVDQTGRVRIDRLRELITHKTGLISIQLANNEIGTIQPIKECIKVARERDVLVHSDAVQAVGKIPVDMQDLDVDLLTLSAHKIYGPKGVGALFIKKGITLEALIHGGGQEGDLRSGTENVLEIVGFGKAAEQAGRILKSMKQVQMLRDRLEEGIASIIKDYRFNGNREHRLPNTLNVTFPGIRGESLVLEMDKRGICFSPGSACHSGSSEPSATLLAMGRTTEQAHCAVRFSLGYQNTGEEIDYVIAGLKEIILNARNIIRFVSCR
ncbi:MAG: IscS subfamily cysteine desulfurase [Candidatus Aminicenantes bacterium]|nr:IscS subfamily cysteine desulfurase [Candidatus Aminicenantes bacterium]